MAAVRRVSATYKDLPGGQVLGPTFDYTHRLLDPSLLEDQTVEEATQRDSEPEHVMRVSDILAQEGLIESDGELPDDHIRRIPAISNSRLTRFKAKLQGEEIRYPERCLVFGQAFHAVALEHARSGDPVWNLRPSE